MNIETIEDLFLFELQRAYSIETRLSEELETLERDVSVDSLDGLQAQELRTEVEELVADERANTADQIERLEGVFEAFGRDPSAHSTAAIDGILAEKERFNNVILNDEIRPLYYAGTLWELTELAVGIYERLCRLVPHLDLPDDGVDVTDALEANLESKRAVVDSLESAVESDDVDSLIDEIVDRAEFG